MIKNMINRLDAGFTETDKCIEAICSDKRALFNPDTYKYSIPIMLLSVSSAVRSQENVLEGALDEAQDAVFSVLDWLFIIIIVSVFIVGAGGLLVGLVRVFSGRVSEGVTSLVIGVICIVIVAILVGVFFSFYEEQRDSLGTT